ncbi:MAG: ABC transporter permease [Xanthomonadaceae bacterium]|nr:ABC transporter permease [Xanthomonadaceae bacterium]MDE2150643.1 ABC transporter permease [Gammaproteobacteria bacterium]
MFAYYFRLALHSLRRNPALTGVMVAAVALGIGASMTVYTVYSALAGDPIPAKSSQLYVPLIDNWGPDSRHGSDELQQRALSYRDAMALLRSAPAEQQTAVYETSLSVKPDNSDVAPFNASAIATFSSFFSMFDVPFQYGGAWRRADDRDRANLVVISKQLNDKLFGRVNSVGRRINLSGTDYRVVGVMRQWQPHPQFYNLNGNAFGETPQVFLPFNAAFDRRLGGDWISCKAAPPQGWEIFSNSECVWVQVWADLPTAAAVAGYQIFLNHYAADQRRSGRFDWPPLTRLFSLRGWLAFNHVVPPVASILLLVAFGFLAVCLVNVIGLMLAKFISRAAEIGLRRALGASRAQVFAQRLIESAVIGLAGGVIGLGLTALGLAAMRAMFSAEVQRIAHLDTRVVLVTLLVAIGSTVLAGLYPTWRTARIAPAWQLKSN